MDKDSVPLSISQQEVLFNAKENAPLWDLVASGDASHRTLLRVEAAEAVSALLRAGLVNLAAEPLTDGEPSGRYLTLPTDIAATVLASDAVWEPGGTFSFRGEPHLIWLGLTESGRAAFAEGAAGDVVARVRAHLGDARAARHGIRQISSYLRASRRRPGGES